MSGDDWQDEHQHVVGMFVSGDPLRSPGPRGEQLHDSSFMVWLNGSAAECNVTLPENKWVQRGAVVLSTDAGNPVGIAVEAGDTITLAPRSLVLLRADLSAADSHVTRSYGR